MTRLFFLAVTRAKFFIDKVQVQYEEKKKKRKRGVMLNESPLAILYCASSAKIYDMNLFDPIRR